MEEVIDIPIIKPEVDSYLKNQLQELTNEKTLITVHCTIDKPTEDIIIRIWKSTFLYDVNSSNKSQLLHAENITIFPYWFPVTKGQSHQFTLYFPSLPKACTSFHLMEKIPENGGFEKRNIARNKEDIYFIHL